MTASTQARNPTPACRILIIDDSPEIQDFLREDLLEPEGHTVLSAYDGPGGLELAQSASPDLILLDMNLPGLNGLEVLGALRQGGCQVEVICISSERSSESILQALRLGACDFLQKPFEADELMEAIQRLQDRSCCRQAQNAHLESLVEVNRALEQRVASWEHLTLFAQIITATLDEANVQSRLIRSINKLLQVEEGSLLLMEEGSDRLRLQISLRGDIEKKGGLVLQPGQGIAGWVAAHNRPALVNDVYQDPRFFPDVDRRTGFVTRATLAVPLVAQDRVLGVIQLINPTPEKGSFNQADLELMQALAASVSVALENARLHRLMRQTVTLETLKQTVGTLSHYINNSLMVLEAARDTLQTLGDHPEMGEILRAMGLETRRIAATIAVLHKATAVRQTAYDGENQMLDIEAELQKALDDLEKA